MLIGFFTRGAVHSERVDGIGRCVALDLLQGVAEVLVQTGCVGVVDVAQVGEADIWVGRNRVGDFIAEGEVEEDGTVVLW